MARITKFERGEINRFQLHDEVDAKLFVQDFDGRRLL